MPFPIPLGDDVLIHPFEYPAKIGLLYVPDKSKKRVNQGIVIAKGPACQYDDIETSDHVFFNGYTGDKITFENGEYFLVPESHLICKVRNSDVVLMDKETVKRIVQERIGELSSIHLDHTTGLEYTINLEAIEKSLLDRIDTITIAEGWEF